MIYDELPIETWLFSIAMLNYQRVTSEIGPEWTSLAKLLRYLQVCVCCIVCMSRRFQYWKCGNPRKFTWNINMSFPLWCYDPLSQFLQVPVRFEDFPTKKVRRSCWSSRWKVFEIVVLTSDAEACWCQLWVDRVCLTPSHLQTGRTLSLP